MRGLLTRVIGLLEARHAVYVLFSLFIGLRALTLLINVHPTSDAGWYFGRAVSIAQGLGYTDDGLPTAYWPVGYPLTLSMLFASFGPHVIVAKLFNLFCAGLTAWLTLDIGRSIFRSETAARLALLLLAIYPNSIGYTPVLFTETYFTALLLTICWVLLNLSGWKRVVVVGVLFALATLVKTQSIVLIPMLFGVVLFEGPLVRSRVISVGAQTIATLLVCCAAIFPWTLRNHQLMGEWIPVSTNGGLTLLVGNNPSAQGDYTEDDPLVMSIHRTVANQIEVDREAKRRAIEWIKTNPGQAAALIPKKLFRLWAPDGDSEWFYQSGFPGYSAHVVLFRGVRFLNQAYYFAVMVAFAIAGVLLVRDPSRRAATRPGWRWLAYVVALFPTIISIVFFGHSRYHYPVMPFAMMTVGWLLVCAIRSPVWASKSAYGGSSRLNPLPTE